MKVVDTGSADAKKLVDVSDFILLQGCYEGDPYEPLGIKVVDYGLLVLIKQIDEIVEFDLFDAVIEGDLTRNCHNLTQTCHNLTRTCHNLTRTCHNLTRVCWTF